MSRRIHVCCGTTENPHSPIEMRVEKNGVDIFRVPTGGLVLTEGKGWKDFAHGYGFETFEDLRAYLDRDGGEYYGAGDCMVCEICGATIVWRV